MGSYTYAHRGGHKGFVTLGVALDERSFRIVRTLGSGDNTQASSGAACIYLIGATAMTQNNIYRIFFRGSLVEAESVSTFKSVERDELIVNTQESSVSFTYG